MIKQTLENPTPSLRSRAFTILFKVPDIPISQPLSTHRPRGSFLPESYVYCFSFLSSFTIYVDVSLNSIVFYLACLWTLLYYMYFSDIYWLNIIFLSFIYVGGYNYKLLISLLSTIWLCNYTTIYLSILLSNDIWVLSSFLDIINNVTINILYKSSVMYVYNYI